MVNLGAFVLGSPEPRRLASFYGALLGWIPVEDDDPDFIRLRDPERERPGLSFQLEPDHVAPVWPPVPGTQQMQGHLDVLVDAADGVDGLAAEVERAISLGAVREDHQPSDGVVVLRDPHGHPFCLFLPGS